MSCRPSQRRVSRHALASVLCLCGMPSGCTTWFQQLMRCPSQVSFNDENLSEAQAEYDGPGVEGSTLWEFLCAIWRLLPLGLF